MVTCWLKNRRTEYMKLTKKISDRKKSGAPALKMTAFQKWIMETLDFLKRHPSDATVDVVNSGDSSDDA